MVSISSVFAGNGMERGYIINDSGFSLDSEITDFLNRKVEKCIIASDKESVVVESIQVREDEVDQGIVDIYYKMDISHRNEDGDKLGELTIELEDASYSNWRNYSEKLSIEVIKGKNNVCF
jgi:hypothetical protein